MDALTRVLFLLQHKHNVVEELLQLLVGEIDTQLLEAVVLRDCNNLNDVANIGKDKCVRNE